MKSKICVFKRILLIDSGGRCFVKKDEQTSVRISQEPSESWPRIKEGNMDKILDNGHETRDQYLLSPL